MNERIKELVLQAGTDTSGKWMGIDNSEKFAELIVKEVLFVQESLINEGHNAWHLHKPTKEHFGVE